jgi:hypothetical protein
MDSDETVRKVKMSLEGFRPLDDDDACLLMGAFRRNAREQRWPADDIEDVCRGVPAKRAFAELSRFVEPTEPEPLSWRSQFRRTRDYVEGCRVLADDLEAKFNPFRFLARGLRVRQ